MEGALWIIDKVLSELETNDEDLRQFEIRFRDRMEENMSQEDWIRSYKELFENISEIQNMLMEKLYVMKESTFKKMGYQKTNNKDSTLLENSKKYGN